MYMCIYVYHFKEISMGFLIGTRKFNLVFGMKFCIIVFIFFLSQVHEHPSEDNDDHYYWAVITGQHTQMFNI